MNQAQWDRLMNTEFMKERVNAICEKVKIEERQEGKKEGVSETVKSMLRNGVSVQNAAQWTNVPLKQVQQWAASL